MEVTNQTSLCPLRLVDNRFGDPQTKGGLGKHLVVASEVKEVLSKYEGRTPSQWAKLGVTIFPSYPPSGEARDDESHDLSFFTLGSDNSENAPRIWINTHNCMGVVRLRDKKIGVPVQMEIGSRFDDGPKQFFLTYLLSKVFGGSVIDLVDLGRDSLWDILLAFLFRRQLLEARAVGLFKQYRTFNHNDTRVRGRIDVNEHLRQNIPFCGTVAYSNHEITFDNPTNHLIRHALTKVKRKWGRWMMGDNRLTEVRLQLELSTPTWQPGDVMACVRRKENRVPIKHPYFLAQYEPLRQLSLALLREEGASLYQQHHEAEGVIFDGSWLWEEYLWTLLEPLGFEHPENKKGVGPWNALPGVRFYPDFFHREDRVILDAKYKRRGGVQDDARQVFAYMFLLNAVHGGLIKPDGMPEARQQIEREGKGAEPAHWHNFVLSPPPAFPAESSAEDFVDKMRMREKEFTECVRSRFGITKAILGSVG